MRIVGFLRRNQGFDGCLSAIITLIFFSTKSDLRVRFPDSPPNQKAFCGCSRGVKASPILYIFETCLINEKGAVHPISVAMFLGLQGSEALSFNFKYQDYGKERNQDTELMQEHPDRHRKRTHGGDV